MIAVARETPLQPAVADLLRTSDEVAAALHTGASRLPIDRVSLDGPDIALPIARQDGVAAGCCVVLDRGDGSAELKRMIVAAVHRRRGVGEALPRAAGTGAARRGATLLLPEVGIGNEVACPMCARAAFTPRGPLAPSVETPISRFLEGPIAPGLGSRSPPSVR